MTPVMENVDVDLTMLARAARYAVLGVSRSGSRQVSPLGAASTDTPFRIASLSKPVTAVATVLALTRAGIALDTPALELLPELRESWRADERVSVADLLSQTSGLTSSVSGDDVARLGDHDAVGVDTARLVVAAGSDQTPGVSWEYYNGNYFLVGAVLASLTSMPFEEAVADLVLRTWGLSSTSFETPPALAPGAGTGTPVPLTAYPRGRRPSGGLCSTAGDLLTFGEHVLADAELLGHLRTPRSCVESVMRYGLGWAIGPSGQMYLNGRLPGYRSALLLVPDHDLVAVSLAADTGALPAQAAILSDLQQHLTGDDLTDAINAFAA